MKFPKLHIFLGAGGVGKTTLSAAFALSLAASGKKVALLSIDPAKRLQSALGIHFNGEEGVSILMENANGGELRVSMLQMEDTLKRWIEQKKMNSVKQKKLMSNPYYTALAEKLASSSDTLAAIYIAEWLERFPQVEDFIIDTAPGLHAIDFIVKPEKVASFLDSKLVDWLKIFVGDPGKDKKSFFSRIVKSGAKKILDGLSLVGGQSFLVNFGEFLISLDEVFLTAMDRLKLARKWIFHSSTNIVLVTAVRDDAVSTTKEFGRILKSLKLSVALSIINRAFPNHLLQEESFQKFINAKFEKNSCEDLFANYFSSYTHVQKRVCADLEKFSEMVIEIPNSLDLDKNQELRLADLCALGQKIQVHFQ
ncbi:MAG: ArsA-related P-loop ATPase [Bdellovibrionota bacterium]